MSSVPRSPAPSSDGSPAPSSDGVITERLAQLVEVLDEAHRNAGRAASLVRVAGIAADEVELALKPVPPHGVYTELLGATVPPRWEAAGVVVHGTARSLGDVDAGLERGERIGDASVVLIVGRDGTTASLLRIDDGEPRVQVGEPQEACAGRIVDVVLRGFDLATAPPEHPLCHAAFGVWLHRVHARVIDAMPVDPGVIDALSPSMPPTWEALREQCAAGRWPELGIHPEIAMWMDEGVFSRACVESFPEPLEVMIELSELLDSTTWVHLVESLGTIRSATPY